MKQEIIDMLNKPDWSTINGEYIAHKVYNTIGTVLNACLNFKKSDSTTKKDKLNKEQDIVISNNFKYSVSEDITIQRIIQNLKESRNWAKEVTFKDAMHAKDINKIFVPLDFYLTPKRTHNNTDNEPKISLSQVDFTEKNYLILGGPGAGKTTLMKKIIIDELDKDSKDKNFLFPFVIQFRHIDNSQNNYTIQEILFEYFGIDVKMDIDVNNVIEKYEKLLKEGEREEEKEVDDYGYYSLNSNQSDEYNYDGRNLEKDDSIDYIEIEAKYKVAKGIYAEMADKYKSFRDELITTFIDSLGILLIFDGFDELPSSQVKDSLIKSIEKLSLGLDNTRFILTSRTGEFDISISNSKTYEIANLTENQIVEFVNNWFVDKSKPEKDKFKVDKMLLELKNSPFRDTALRPLNLAHLCALFERNGEIPRKPKTVYRKIVNLLIEDWDEQRNIKRPSKFSQFTLDRKFDFLSNLAYYLTAKFVKVFFTTDLLRKAYEDICEKYDLPKREVKVVINELESFTGLFIKSGDDRFEFSHKSLQEYLAGEYVVRTNLLLLRKQFLLEMPNELAIAISLSSSPSLFLATIIFELGQLPIPNNFVVPLFQRLQLEKPDFESTYILALCLVYLHNRLKQFSYYSNDIDELIFGCANKEILKKSFLDLKDKYWRIDEKHVDPGVIKAQIMGGLSLNYDLSEINVPAPYNSYILMDEVVQTYYNQ